MVSGRMMSQAYDLENKIADYQYICFLFSCTWNTTLYTEYSCISVHSRYEIAFNLIMILSRGVYVNLLLFRACGKWKMWKILFPSRDYRSAVSRTRT